MLLTELNDRSWLRTDLQPPEIDFRLYPSFRHSGQGPEGLKGTLFGSWASGHNSSFKLMGRRVPYALPGRGRLCGAVSATAPRHHLGGRVARSHSPYSRTCTAPWSPERCALSPSPARARTIRDLVSEPLELLCRVVPGQEFQEMTAWVTKVDPTASVPVIDLHVLRGSGPESVAIPS